MDFKLKCTLGKNLWVSHDQTSRLVQVVEKIPHKDFTKSWAIWLKTEMYPEVEYLIEGYISEAPNKGFMNEQGKVAYKANFNAMTVIPLDEKHAFPDATEYDPSLENIPF